MKRIVVFFVVMSCLLVTATHAKTYKLGIVPWAGFSPANVADVKGFWKAAGVDISVYKFNSNSDMHKAFAQQRLDLAIDITGGWVGMAMDGVPVTILAEIDWSSGGDKIILKKGLDASALKGQVMGVYDASPATLTLIHNYLKDHGLQLTDVKRVEFAVEELPKKFMTTRMPAILCYDPFALQAEKEGNGVVAASSATYPGSIADSIVIRTDVLRAAPKEDILNFLKGWVEAVNWIQDETHWAEYQDILNQKTFEGDAPHSEEDLRGILAGVRIHDVKMLREQNQTGGGVFVYVQALKEILAANDMLKKDFVPEQLIDNTFMMEVLPK